MKKALIFNGKIVQVEALAGIFPVSVGMEWIDCPDTCLAYSWRYENGSILEPLPPSADEIKQTMIDAIQKHLDTTAKTRGYDGILSLASYAASTHPPFAAEGRAGADWRDSVWGYGYRVLADVQAGTRTIPTVAELIAELPAMVWPA